jgi:hypothetical protein
LALALAIPPRLAVPMVVTAGGIAVGWLWDVARTVAEGNTMRRRR